MIQTTTYRPRRVTKVVTTKRDVKSSPNGQTKKGRRKRKRKVNHNRKMMDTVLNNHIRIIADPCHGPIERAIGHGSIIQRVRSTLSQNVSGSATCGYFIWFPDFHNAGEANAAASNTYYWNGANSSIVPTNTVAEPLGQVAADTTGFSVPDPASAIVSSEIYSRGQTVSACMQLDYLGALSSISGQVAIIRNVPIKLLATSNTTVTVVAPSVDDLFAYASTRERMQPSGHEVVYRPSDDSSILRTAGGTTTYSAFTPDAVMKLGTGGVSDTLLVAGQPNNVYGVAIAWKGIPSVAGNIQVNLIKVISLELAPSGNSIEPTFSGSAKEGPEPIDTITSFLDRKVPNWQSKAINSITNVAGTLARAYSENIGVSSVARRNNLRLTSL